YGTRAMTLAAPFRMAEEASGQRARQVRPGRQGEGQGMWRTCRARRCSSSDGGQQVHHDAE
ncbi:hypothetical protein LAN17_24580, partial [Mycobacterium tuberculosis]|nr:hypothetical protein [Mycobacterium tuberculosis]